MDTEDESAEIDKLFEDVMKNNWKAVISTYNRSPKTREAKLTKTGDTALHIAVSNDKTDIASEMVDVIEESMLKKISNAKENTPLHLAAMLGNLEVCKKLASKSKDLITLRNKSGETPIFLAALHGKQNVFLYLRQSEFEIKEEYLRRNNGDTILHVAISNEYFGMAMAIIDEYKNLVDLVNVDGLSPLHVLANKPNAFKSSTRLGLFDRIMYYCLVVDDGVMEREICDKIKVDIEKYRKHSSGGKNLNKTYPENYETCMDLVSILQKIFTTAINTMVGLRDKLLNYPPSLQVKGSKKDGYVADEENPQEKISSPEQLGCDDITARVPSLSVVGNSEPKSGIQEVSASSNSASSPAGEKNSSQKRNKQPQAQDLVKERQRSRNEHFFPPNYDSFLLLFKLMMKILLIILGVGIWRINEIQRKKELHIRAKLVMEKLIKYTKAYKSYGNTGSNPNQDSTAALLSLNMLEDHKSQEPDSHKNTDKSRPTTEKGRKKQRGKRKGGKEQTALLIAAKTGATEMVEKILDEFPVAIQDVDSEQKNVVLLAIENRQPQVYKFLLRRENIPKESVFRHVDHRGNSALHLAATQCGLYRPWLIPGSALQMQWEIKWFEFVKNSMPPNFFPHYNKRNQTPNEVFVNTHKDLIKDGSEWLTKTSESCSVVAALVATVAFATSATVPGGINQDRGTPTLEDKPAFNAFAISSLAALCFSVTALVFFLSILTSRYQEKDFALDLPRKLLLGLTSLFASIASMLVSFCAGHIFVLSAQLRYIAYPLYTALCFPITFFFFAQLSLYFDLILAIFKKVPQRSYEVLPH